MAKLSKDYWKDRQLQTFLDGEKNALQLTKKLKKDYDLAIQEIEKEINAFYGKYAKENKITLTEAKKLLNNKELKSFNNQLQEYIEYGEQNNFGDAYLRELNLLKYRTKLSRLEELKINIKYKLAKLYSKTDKQIIDELSKEYSNAYFNNIFDISKQVGLSFSFVQPAEEVIKKYLMQTINIENYAIGENQIWEYKIPKLMNILDTRIPQGITLGYNPNKVARLAADPVEKDFNNIVRLVRTEYNYIFNQATMDSYENCYIKQYQILTALDERTCEHCGPLDLQKFNVDEKEVGVNCPPFHPNCRCTTIPYFEPDEFDKKGKQRIAKDSNNQAYFVPADLSYTEWKAGLVEDKNGNKYWKPSKGAR